jgi:hypothetical protein
VLVNPNPVGLFFGRRDSCRGGLRAGVMKDAASTNARPHPKWISGTRMISSALERQCALHFSYSPCKICLSSRGNRVVLRAKRLVASNSSWHLKFSRMRLRIRSRVYICKGFHLCFTKNVIRATLLKLISTSAGKGLDGILLSLSRRAGAPFVWRSVWAQSTRPRTTRSFPSRSSSTSRKQFRRNREETPRSSISPRSSAPTRAADAPQTPRFPVRCPLLELFRLPPFRRAHPISYVFPAPAC